MRAGAPPAWLFGQYPLASPHSKDSPILTTRGLADSGFQASYFGGGADWFSLVGGTIPFSRR